MKRFLALAAIVALALPSIAFAEPTPGGLVWKELQMRTTVTSTTSPTYAGIGSPGGATNPGTFTRDSAAFTINTANQRDTTEAFTLADWTPGPWSLDGGSVAADSMWAFIVTISPRPGSALTAGADSFYVTVESGTGGTLAEFAPTTLGYTLSGGGFGMAEVGSANMYAIVIYHSGDATFQAGAAGITPMLFPKLRLTIQGDASAANTGEYVVKVGYFKTPTTFIPD